MTSPLVIAVFAVIVWLSVTLLAALALMSKVDANLASIDEPIPLWPLERGWFLREYADELAAHGDGPVAT